MTEILSVVYYLTYEARQTLQEGFLIKKLIGGVLAVLLATLGISLLSLAPANASETKDQAICHFDNGHGGGFNQIVVSKNSIVKKNGDEGGHGTHTDDIIPPFSYNFGGNDTGNFTGLNWTTDSQKVWANSCKTTGTVLTPVIPSTVLGTCLNPAGAIIKPTQPAGVDATYEFKNSIYGVTFSKPDDTAYNTYSFPKDFTNPVTVMVTPPGPGDQYWDDTKNSCNLPDTGASGLSTSALVIGGGLIFLGLIAFSITNIMSRRKK